MMHSGSVLDRANGFSVLDCSDCGFIHLNPVPTENELDKVYREEYYTDEKPLFIERVIEDLPWWDSVYNDRYEFFESKLPENRRSVLDIGCGPGYFLKAGMERGWKGFGVEPSSRAAAHARSLGLEVMNTFFDTGLASALKKRFDAVHLSEVLEHVPDPSMILKAAGSLMNEGGLICCVVPNDYSPVQKVLKEKLHYKPYWLAPPHHINYSLGRASHARRKKLDLMLSEPELKGFKKEMYELMAKHGIGREMIIYGEKRNG